MEEGDEGKKISHYQWHLVGPSCSPLFLYLCIGKKIMQQEGIETGSLALSFLFYPLLCHAP